MTSLQYVCMYVCNYQVQKDSFSQGLSLNMNGLSISVPAITIDNRSTLRMLIKKEQLPCLPDK